MIAPLLLLFAAILASLWIARRSGVVQQFAELGRLSHRSVRTMARRGVSDIWKERATRILSIRMMARSLSAAGLLLLIAAPVVLVLALDPIANLGTMAVFTDVQARLWLLTMGIGLAAIRYALRRRDRLRQA